MLVAEGLRRAKESKAETQSRGVRLWRNIPAGDDASIEAGSIRQFAQLA
jgi:hypothetical protein